MRLPVIFPFVIMIEAAFGLAVAHAQVEALPSSEPIIVFFAWDRPIIDRDAATQLDSVAAAFQRSPGRVTVVGHADRSGPDAPNLRSARKRAEAVQAYLASRGVPRAAMSVISYGESRPLIATADGVREPQNRRVEVIVTTASGS